MVNHLGVHQSSSGEAKVLEFFSMGGYAAYVWSAFGFSLILMCVLFWTSVTNAKRAATEFEQLKSELRPRRSGTRKPMRAKRASETGANISEQAGG